MYTQGSAFFRLCLKKTIQPLDLEPNFVYCSNGHVIQVRPVLQWNRKLTLKRQSQLQQRTNFAKSFPIFDKNKVWYYMRIVCLQTILMKYHALFVIFEKAAKVESVVCCKL